jgi:hypothetical protein
MIHGSYGINTDGLTPPTEGTLSGLGYIRKKNRLAVVDRKNSRPLTQARLMNYACQ